MWQITTFITVGMSNGKISPWISNSDDFTSQSANEVDRTVNWCKSWYWNGRWLVYALPVLDLQQNVRLIQSIILRYHTVLNSQPSSLLSFPDKTTVTQGRPSTCSSSCLWHYREETRSLFKIRLLPASSFDCKLSCQYHLKTLLYIWGDDWHLRHQKYHKQLLLNERLIFDFFPAKSEEPDRKEKMF